MFVGKVIGTVWSTVKWPELAGHKLLIVRPYHLDTLRAKHGEKPAASSQPKIPQPKSPEPKSPEPKSRETEIPETVVCIDLLDAGVGDDVVVAFGHAARVAAQSETAGAHAGPGGRDAAHAENRPTQTPIDAAVVAVVDGYSLPDLEADLANPVALDGTTR